MKGKFFTIIVFYFFCFLVILAQTFGSDYTEDKLVQNIPNVATFYEKKVK